MFSYIVTKNYKIKTKNIKFEQKLEKNRKKTSEIFSSYQWVWKGFCKFLLQLSKIGNIINANFDSKIFTYKIIYIKYRGKNEIRQK